MPLYFWIACVSFFFFVKMLVFRAQIVLIKCGLLVLLLKLLYEERQPEFMYGFSEINVFMGSVCNT